MADKKEETQRIVYAFMEYLQEIRDSELQVSDPDSVDVVLSVLGETTGVSLADDLQRARFSLRAKQCSLPALFAGQAAPAAAGQAPTSPATAQPAPASSSSPAAAARPHSTTTDGKATGDGESEFKEFVALLAAKGFFKSHVPGSQQHNALLEQARNKWTERRKKQADDEKAQGNLKLGQQDYAGAVAHYTRAIALDSDNAVFYSNRSLAITNKLVFSRRLKRCIYENL
eukprot:g81110.t1